MNSPSQKQQVHQLNAQRLLCPIPVIRTQDKIKTLNKGDLLEVLCTDPGTLQDIPTWCRINGHHVVDTQQEDRLIKIIIKVGQIAP